VRRQSSQWVVAAFFCALAACRSSGGPAAPVSVTISPKTATVNQGASQTFTATVTGATDTVTWTVTESAGGAVTSAGVYTAPMAAGTFHVVATSAADTTQSDTATITVPVSVAIVPTSATLNPGQSQTFAATVSGAANTAVTWSVQEGASGRGRDGPRLRRHSGQLAVARATSRCSISTRKGGNAS
jgi:hypothetical protein